MKLFLCRVIFVFSLIPSSAFAQFATSSDDLQPLKMDITDQVVEHSRLQQENNRLRQEYQNLQIRYADRLKELEASAEAQRMQAAILQNRLDSREFSQKSIEEMGSDIMIKKAQISRLKIMLMDLQEQERLWKMKFADAEYQKQALELEMALKQNHYEQQAGAYISKIDQLNRAILRNRTEEKELLVQYSMLEDESRILAQQQKIFENENVYLSREEARYQGLKDKVKNEIEGAQQTQAVERQKFQQAVEDKKKQKADLEEQLTILRQQQKSLDEQLTQALQQLERREQLTADIIRLKKDNDRLQATIASLQSKAGQITP